MPSSSLAHSLSDDRRLSFSFSSVCLFCSFYSRRNISSLSAVPSRALPPVPRAFLNFPSLNLNWSLFKTVQSLSNLMWPFGIYGGWHKIVALDPHSVNHVIIRRTLLDKQLKIENYFKFALNTHWKNTDDIWHMVSICQSHERHGL